MYDYREMKKELFSEEGLELFVKIRDNAKNLLSKAGAFRMDAILSSETGDTWMKMACIDKMVETGEIRELTSGRVMGQHRVFVTN